MTRGKLDKLERRVEKRLENSVPFDLWEHAEQMYYAYIYKGQRCPSSAPLSSMQVTERKKKSDITS